MTNGAHNKGEYGDRTKKIIQALKGYTFLTQGYIPLGMLTVIADQFGITRERARQIAKREGFIMAHEVKRGKLVQCRGCGVDFEQTHGSRQFHNQKCREDYYEKSYWNMKTCVVCKTRFKALKTRTGKFCTKKCQGIWLGQSNRGTTLPINRRKSYLMIKKHFGYEWFTVKEMIDKLGISETMAYTNTLLLRKILDSRRKPEQNYKTKQYRIKEGK